MIRPAILRSAVRASSRSFRPVSAARQTRLISATAALSKNGEYSRTDDKIRVQYPEDKDLRKSGPAQGRGGIKRTLASFSLEDKVAVVTGGARGLGLVMSQGLVTSGASVAIVDLNSLSPPSQLPLAVLNSPLLASPSPR